MMRRAPDHNRLVHGLDRRWRAASSVAAILVCWLAACSTASAPADASPGDAANLDPMCQTNEDGTRTCVCEGGAGQAFTLACDSSSSTCFVYRTTCVDVGFLRCSTESSGDLRAKCHAFCATYSGTSVDCSGL